MKTIPAAIAAYVKKRKIPQTQANHAPPFLDFHQAHATPVHSRRLRDTHKHKHAHSCIYRCKCGVPLSDFFFHQEGYSGKKHQKQSSWRGLSTCLYSASAIPVPILLLLFPSPHSPSLGQSWILVPVQASFPPGAPTTTTTTTTVVHEGTDGERGQCSAGESGLLSLSVQGGEGTLLSGSGAAAAAGAEGDEDRGRWGRWRGGKRQKISWRTI